MIISFAHVLKKIREKGHTFSLQVKPRHNFRFRWLQRGTVPPTHQEWMLPGPRSRQGTPQVLDRHRTVLYLRALCSLQT